MPQNAMLNHMKHYIFILNSLFMYMKNVLDGYEFIMPFSNTF